MQENINESEKSKYYRDTSNQPVEKDALFDLAKSKTKGNTIIKTMINSLKRFLPNNVKARVAYTGQEFGIKFEITDKTKDQHKHYLLYYSKCLKPTCNEDHLGETGRRIIERSADHCGKD